MTAASASSFSHGSDASLALDAVDVALVNGLQEGFPLCASPYDEAGRTLGLDGAALRTRLQQLLARRVLTRFGPLYQIERLGGRFVLAALAVPEDRYEAVTRQVNAQEAVAHNYRRDHALNMWFVLATESPAAMQAAVARIEADTGLEVHVFPKLQEYFVGMRFTVGGHQPVGRAAPPAHAQPAAAAAASAGKAGGVALLQDARVQALVRATQAGLPLVPEPYAAVAEALGEGWDETQVRAELGRLLAAGVIRRIGVVPNHYAIGYRHNAMAVFDVEDTQIESLGPRVGALDFVTHCYRRPRHLPLWPYSLFAMCHGASREAVLEQVEQIRALLGPACRAHDALFSTAILKKTGLRV